MAKQWRDTHQPKGDAGKSYYIRGVHFVDGVAQGEVKQSVAEFFLVTGVIEEDVPGTEAPTPAPEAEEAVKTAEEQPEKPKPTRSRSRASKPKE